MASSLDQTLAAAKRRQKELSDQEAAIRDQLTQAKATLDSIPFESPADQERNKNKHDAAMVELSRIQANALRAQDDRQKAQSDVAAITDKINSPDPQDAASQANLARMQANFDAGKGFVSDAQAQANARQDQSRADAIANQAANREENAAARTQNQGQFERKMTFEERQAKIAEELRRGEISAKEAELKYNAAFNEAKIALDNVKNQNDAAASILQSESAARGQNINAVEGGQKTSLGVMGFLLQLNKAGMMKMSPEEFIQQIGVFTDLVNKEGIYNLNAAGPAPKPLPTLTQTAAGGSRVNVPSSGKPVQAPLPGEMPGPQPGDTPAQAAARTFLQQKYDEWINAKAAAQDTTAPTLDAFREHIKATGSMDPNAEAINPDTQQPLTNEEITRGTGLAPNIPNAPTTTTPIPENIPPAVPNTPLQTENTNLIGVNRPAAFGPDQPQASAVGGIHIYNTPAPPVAPAPTPAPQSDPLQNGEAQQHISHAASAETINMLSEAGFDPAIIQQFAEKQKFDPNQPNPFLQSLQSA